jgi:hypothetical protein
MDGARPGSPGALLARFPGFAARKTGSAGHSVIQLSQGCATSDLLQRRH